MRGRPDQVLRLIVFGMGALAALAAAVELADTAPFEREASAASDDPLRRELARCRTLTPEELETDSDCRAAWAENRRRFFGAPVDKRDEE